MLASAAAPAAFESVDDLTVLALELRRVAVQDGAGSAAFLGTQRSCQRADALTTARNADAGAPRGMGLRVAARINLAIYDAVRIGAWRKVGG